MENVDTATFIDAVVPSGNRYVGFTSSARPGVAHLPFTDATSVNRQMDWAKKHGANDLYFALASFKEQKIDGKPCRKQTNVDKLKSIWLDVDFKAYDKPVDCVLAVKEFLADIPSPTFVVNSGGGLHLYWCFEKPLPVPQWQMLATGLAALAKARRLRADLAVTIDSARVLRIPGSTNPKYDHKPVCTITGQGALVNLERMEELLLKHAAATGNTGISILVDPAVSNLFDPATNNDLSDGYESHLTSEFSLIAKECPTVADAIGSGGADNRYNLWKDLLHLAAFTTDGGEYIHAISKKYDSYDRDETIMRYEESVRARDGGTSGPTTCARVSATSSKCATCKYLGVITSPWSLGVTKKLSEDPTFVVGGDTYMIKYEKSMDPEVDELVPVKKLVVRAALTNWVIVPALDDPENDIHLWVDCHAGSFNETIMMAPIDLVDAKSTKRRLFSKYFTWNDHEIKLFMEAAMAWINKLRRSGAAVRPTAFGWNRDTTTFTIGNIEYTKDGELPVAISAALGDEYKPTGKLDAWRDIAQMLCDSEHPEFSFLLAAGFAGPLMQIGTPLSIAISAFSRHSGAGKSTVLKTIQAAFGRPEKMMALDDSHNFIIGRMGMTQGIPAIWDEIRGAKIAQDLTSTLFRLTQGKTKGRMNSRAEVQQTYNLNSMLLVGTNTPISEFVHEQVKQTDAGAMRFIEIELDIHHAADTRVQDRVSALGANYGMAGAEYIRHLVAHRDSLEKAMVTVAARVDGVIKFKNQERFWRDAIIKIVTAAYIMRQCGLVGIDPKRVLDYSVECIATQREELEGTVQEDTGSLMPDFIVAQIDNLLITETFPDGKGVKFSGAILRAPARKAVTVHISTEDNKLRVAMAAVREHAAENNLSYRTILHAMRDLGGTKVRASLGAGTVGFSMPRTYIMEFDAKEAVGDAMLATWTA